MIAQTRRLSLSRLGTREKRTCSLKQNRREPGVLKNREKPMQIEHKGDVHKGLERWAEPEYTGHC